MLFSVRHVFPFVTKFSQTLRTAVFWFITQRVMVIPCRRFGTIYRSHLQASRTQKVSPKRR